MVLNDELIEQGYNILRVKPPKFVILKKIEFVEEGLNKICYIYFLGFPIYKNVRLMNKF
jgi:hypothetical protein